MRTSVNAGFIYGNNTVIRAAATTMFTVIEADFPDFSPTKCGPSEPIKHVVEPGRSLDALAAHWDWNFLWRAKGSNLTGSWLEYRYLSSSGSMTMWGSPKKTSRDRLFTVIERLAEATPPLFGYIQFVTTAEYELYGSKPEIWNDINLGIFARQLSKGIPNVPALIVFGPEYVDFLGLDVLERVPFALKRYDPVNRVFIGRVMESVKDLESRTVELEARRKAVADALPGIFMAHTEGPCRIPPDLVEYGPRPLDLADYLRERGLLS